MYLNDDLIDLTLQGIEDQTENLYICSAEPTTFAEASSTYKLGTKASPTFTGPADGDVSGRKLTIDAITDGVIDSNGTPVYLALTDNSESKLLYVKALDSGEPFNGQAVFTMNSCDIETEDPA